MRKNQSLLFEVSDEEEIRLNFPGVLPAFRKGIRSFLSVPLVSGNQILGTLHFRSTKTDIYTPEHLHLAERMATNITGARANTQLHASLRREDVERTALAEIGRIVGSSPDIGEIYDRFVAEVSKLISFDRVAVGAVDLKKRTATFSYVSG